MKIRKATKKDISHLRKLILNCIKKKYKRYSKKKIKAMQDYSSEKRLKEYIKKWNVFIFIEDDKIKGTISLENKKILFSLYSINSKIKKELINFIEEECRKTKKIIAIVMPENKKEFLAEDFKVVEKIILTFGRIKFNELKMVKMLK